MAEAEVIYRKRNLMKVLKQHRVAFQNNRGCSGYCLIGIVLISFLQLFI